jgi:hypothetical protein
MVRWTRVRRIIAGCVVVAWLMTTTGCFGPFNLTKNVYHWNSGLKGSGEVNEKWMKELVFFGMIVVPVYMFSALLDAFVFNSIQFWTGENPVKATLLEQGGATHVVYVGDTTVKWATREDGAVVTYERKGSRERRATIVPALSGYRLVDEQGHTLAQAQYQPDGSLRVSNQDGHIVQEWSIEQFDNVAGR